MSTFHYYSFTFQLLCPYNTCKDKLFWFKLQRYSSDLTSKNHSFRREPWSSGYGRRLTFWRPWVWISVPYTGWTFFTLIFCKIVLMFVWKRPKINKKEAIGPFKKTRIECGAICCSRIGCSAFAFDTSTKSCNVGINAF